MIKSHVVTSSEILKEFSIEKYFWIRNSFVFDTPRHRRGTQTDINSLSFFTLK